jgi:hypothetical protein
MTFRFVRRGIIALLVACPLGGCFTLNPSPTAYEDSLCPKRPPSYGEVVNYDCVRGKV